MKTRHEDVDRLVALLRADPMPRRALLDWAEESPGSGPLALARRLRLGQLPEDAIRSSTAFGVATEAVASAFALHRHTGASLAQLVEEVAVSGRVKAEADREAGAGSAGARLSARLVAGLPIVFVPLMPATRASLFDITGSALVALGVLLSALGFRWVSSLIPVAPEEDPVARLAGWLAAVLRSGGTLQAGLEAAEDACPALGTELERVKRFRRLGAPPVEAMCRVGGRIDPVGRVLARSYERGLPSAASLSELARARRAALRHEFDASLRRAPVAMVLPLTLCVLPAYVLLGLGPFIRGINFS